MSLGRKFASIFVDVGEAPVPEKKPVTKPDLKPATAPIVMAVIPGQVDSEMAKILEDAINEANIPGFDYLEFREVLANMSTINLPEAQKFQAAFASAQISKVTKQQLLEAIDFYLKVINAKEAEFNNFVVELKSTDIDGKDQKISDLDKEIEADAAKIQELTASISQRRQQQDAIRMEKAQADMDIRNKTSAFAATKNSIVERLTSDRNKINSYIQ